VTTTNGAPGCRSSPTSASFSVTIPAILTPCPGAQPCGRFPGGPAAVTSRLQPLARHVAPRQRIVALFARPRARGEQRFEPIEIDGRRRELGFGGARIGVGARDLRLGLANVFGPRARQHQAELRVGLGALGGRAGEGQPRVGSIESGDDIARPHVIAFVDAKLEQASTDLCGHADVRGLDLPGDADAVRRSLLAARRGERGGQRHGEPERSGAGRTGGRHDVGLAGGCGSCASARRSASCMCWTKSSTDGNRRSARFSAPSSRRIGSAAI
jgi:hypothetical protein